MARKGSTAVATAAGGSNSAQALTTLDAELSQSAIALRGAIGGPAGKSIKVKPTGNFITPEGHDLGSEFQCVIVDFMSKNMFYSTPFSADNPVPPDCYAANKLIAAMVPDPESPAVQAESCNVCPLNAFGSGNNGKSKACKNTRELALIVIDAHNPNAHLEADAPIYTLSLTPTALRSFDGFVSNAIRTLGGPPIKAIVTVAAENVGTYAAVSFHDMVPNPHYAVHAARRAEAADLLARKPDFSVRQPTRKAPARPAPRRAGAAPTRAAAGGR